MLPAIEVVGAEEIWTIGRQLFDSHHDLMNRLCSPNLSDENAEQDTMLDQSYLTLSYYMYQTTET